VNAGASRGEQRPGGEGGPQFGQPPGRVHILDRHLVGAEELSGPAVRIAAMRTTSVGCSTSRPLMKVPSA
jgi:hypothetical protein